MIITKTPFRISFCGGGSDMEDFYKEHGGCVLSTTINRYVYLIVHPYFEKGRTVLKYSENERVDDLHDIHHSIFRCVLRDMNISGVEITSTADIPSGTGLGSSSSFTVGLLHTMYCYQGKYVSKARLAEEACETEIEKLGAPIGKQDQYAAAFGGLNFITFRPNGTVGVEPLIAHKKTLGKLQENLVMFYTGLKHDANKILSEQKSNISQKAKAENLQRMCELAHVMKDSVEKGQLEDFGSILDESWQKKRELAGSISNSYIDDLYECAMKNGAMGGKLLGAGGGGFLLFYCPREKQPRLAQALNLETFPFSFEYDGSSVVYIGDKYWEEN